MSCPQGLGRRLMGEQPTGDEDAWKRVGARGRDLGCSDPRGVAPAKVGIWCQRLPSWGRRLRRKKGGGDDGAPLRAGVRGGKMHSKFPRRISDIVRRRQSPTNVVAHRNRRRGALPPQVAMSVMSYQ